MNQKQVVLVTGATGVIGVEVCEALARRDDVQVRAALRTPEKRAALPDSVETVEFDFERPETVDRALDGVDSLFLLTPGGPAGPEFTRVVTSRLGGTSVQRVVKQSSFTPQLKPQTMTDLWAVEAESIVREVGLPCTFLEPPWCNQNFTRGYFAGMVAMGELALPFGDGSAGWIDCRDVADVAVNALLNEGHEGKSYTLTGPELIDFHEISSILSDVAGRAIAYRPISEEEYVENCLKLGMPPIAAKATLAVITKTRDGHAAIVSPDAEKVTGRRPRTFRAFADDYAQAIRGLASG